MWRQRQRRHRAKVEKSRALLSWRGAGASTTTKGPTEPASENLLTTRCLETASFWSLLLNVRSAPVDNSFFLQMEQSLAKCLS